MPEGAQFCPKCGKPAPMAAAPEVPEIPPPAATTPAAATTAPPVVTPPVATAAPLPSAPTRATPTAAPPVTHPTTSHAPAATHGRSALWWIVPLALLVIGGILFMLLTGAPYGRDDAAKVAPTDPQTETIAEGESAPTATLVEPGDASSTVTSTDFGTTTDAPPSNMDTAAPTATAPILREEPPPAVTGQPANTTLPPRTREQAPPAAAPPVTRTPVQTRPPVQTAPPVVRPRVVTPPPVRSAQSQEISRDEAVNVLRGYVTGRDYYGIGTTCTSIRGGEYRNVGYTLEVHDSCTNRLLGLWRVDSKTREVFRQQPDGRFLRP